MPIPASLRASIRRLVRRVTPAAPLGQQGEIIAAHLLRRKGYVIVAGGRRSRYGEIDLIAVENRQTVVFVEVKTRRSLRAGRPAEAVDLHKQRRIANAALAYLKAHGLLEHPARFDVVAVLWPKGEAKPSVEHFVAAFDPPGRGRFFG